MSSPVKRSLKETRDASSDEDQSRQMMKKHKNGFEYRNFERFRYTRIVIPNDNAKEGEEDSIIWEGQDIPTTVEPDDARAMNPGESSSRKKDGSDTEMADDTESSAVQDISDTQRRHYRRRSAAPSPFASAYSSASQPKLIGIQDINSIAMEVLKPSADNPGRCPCGWYEFYAICAHSCRTEPFKCGARQSRSGVTIFCKLPAPRHSVDQYIINQPCPRCLDPTFDESMEP